MREKRRVVDSKFGRLFPIMQIHTGTRMSRFTSAVGDVISPPITKRTFLIRDLLTCLQDATRSRLLLSILPSLISSKISYSCPGRGYTYCPYPPWLLTILPLYRGIWFSSPPLAASSMQRASKILALTNVTPT